MQGIKPRSIIKMKIISKGILVETADTKITKLDVFAPEIAEKASPGQFIVLMVVEKGERIPLTIVDCDRKEGVISLIFQEIGLTTRLLGKLDPGDYLYALVGPLGNPTEVEDYGRIIVVGGGVGAAEIYPLVKALKEKGNRITSIIGARAKELLILKEELKNLSDEFYSVTDDGSFGRKGFTTDILKELISRTKYDLVYAVGPIPMMKNVSLLTKSFNIKTVVSLNALMVDATGMCGCCRVNVDGEIKFSCVDGPDFNAHLVDWDELEKRNKVYQEKEKHLCRLFLPSPAGV